MLGEGDRFSNTLWPHIHCFTSFLSVTDSGEIKLLMVSSATKRMTLSHEIRLLPVPHRLEKQV